MMLAVAVWARALTADPRIEVTLSPRLRTPPLPVTPAGVADRWRNIGSCRKTSLLNALQVEKMLRIARIGTENWNKQLGVTIEAAFHGTLGVRKRLTHPTDQGGETPFLVHPGLLGDTVGHMAD